MKPHGFTLIELMVSVTIFIVVMTVSLGALLAMSASDRKAESVKTIMNNLSFALESMSRNIRTGYDYGCNGSIPGDCTSGGYRFSFTAADGNSVTYCLGSGSSCGTSTSCQSASCSILRSINAGTFYSLTAPEVNISNFSFYLQGSDPDDTIQPRVIMTLNGTISINQTQQTDFELQTSVTQRLYDQ